MTTIVCRCPVPDCGRKRNPGHMMCRPHWFSVPQSLRSEIWRLWKLEPLGVDYMKARQAAIDAATP